MSWYAHTPGKNTDWEPLRKHLLEVKEMCGSFAAKLGWQIEGELLGLVHDAGKYNPDFRDYLEQANQGLNPTKGSVDHKSAGVHLLKDSTDLGHVTFAHHGSLPDRVDLLTRVQERWDSIPLKLVVDNFMSEMGSDYETALNKWKQAPGKYSESSIRFLLSCLVDADRICTARHCNPELDLDGPDLMTLKDAKQRFDAYCSKQKQSGSAIVQKVRDHIFHCCLDAAKLPPGVFRLTAPTGGGKTRSSLGFALEHAEVRAKDRIIYAVPYTSIIDQIAAEFRLIFGETAPVLEHHSNVPDRSGNSDEIAKQHEQWAVAARDNWDAPIIVTTTVQLLESLLSSRSSRCRKLHRIYNSIIIFDEVQVLPIRLLDPILSILKTLVSHYKVTILLCTATQPNLAKNDKYLSGFGEGNITEIVTDAKTQYNLLKRVKYAYPDEEWDWDTVANKMTHTSRCMTVVNLRSHAYEIFQTLPTEARYYLSTMQCPEHRRQMLSEIRAMLKDKENNPPCRLVSTQVVEAGVDIDFPCVFRALGPLDRIVQSAGRCNREYLEDYGLVTIFRPKDSRVPLGEYARSTEKTRRKLQQWRHQDLTEILHDPDIFTGYYGALYTDLPTDEKQIQIKRKYRRYAQVGEDFRLINQETIPVIVPYNQQDFDEVIEALKSKKPTRKMWRKIQGLTVHLYENTIKELSRVNLIKESDLEGLWIWQGDYDSETGIGKRIYELTASKMADTNDVMSGS